MNYSYKLNGIPPIRYLNLNERVDKKNYIENEFKNHNIKNYTRISADRYHPDNFPEWKNSLIIEKQLNHTYYISILVNQLQSIIDWYYENSSETCLILEDDLNFSLIKYWTFDWEYMISRLPCNWDCVQFHVIGTDTIIMGLNRRVRNSSGATCYMINRTYAEKLIKMHYIDGKFKFYTNYGYKEKWWTPTLNQSPDHVPYEIGITYSFPIFITNSNFISDCSNIKKPNPMVKKSDYYVAKWWKEKSNEYSLDNIFELYNSEKKNMIFTVEYKPEERGLIYEYEN